MRTRSGALLALAFAACGHHHDAHPCTGAQPAQLSLVRVDDNSDYMQRASAAAHDAAVRVEVDRWKVDGHPDATDVYFRAPDRAAIEHYVASLPPIPADHQLAYEHDKLGWRTFYVRATPILDASALASGEPEDRGARFELTRAGAKIFDDASTEAVGHKLAFVVDGEVVSAPIVNMPIRGGKIQITTPDPADATKLLERLGCTK